MPVSSWIQANRKVFLIARIIGICVFALAFLLPACRLGPDAPETTVFSGWKCASVALSETLALFGKSVTGPPSFEVILVVLSGWINPLVLLVLIFSVAPRIVIIRRILGGLILLCMVATWTFFGLEKLTPLIGHFLWIAGALLILVYELVPAGRKESLAP